MCVWGWGWWWGGVGGEMTLSLGAGARPGPFFLGSHGAHLSLKTIHSLLTRS